ncbi:kinase-like domain-containing protein [Cantharellus anzutake]|uniref:kinase-like domain-containing protein n=1 Tax=Cantharellus anzutake TaxID=1750568 RepID=UPI001905D586|nr:kinase-like domain-containing protein [Cantharellus anzutake]KAF8331347.1 kinase-like domain-containing protein [Cantharellus anzutake]
MSILPEMKLTGIYDNPYDYLPHPPQLGTIGQAELDAIIASGILADNTVPIPQYVLPEDDQMEYGNVPVLLDQLQVEQELSVNQLIPSDSAQTVSAVPEQPEKPASKKYSLNDFYFHNTLGTGSFGRVHLVQSTHNHCFYAIKVLAKEKIVKLKQVEHTNNERELLMSCKHDFLINLWGTFQDRNSLFMVMDFVAGGELFTLIRKSVRFPNAVAKFYAAEVALALEYLHKKDIIYRDLKPENILIGQDGHIKLTDFGFAKRVPDQTYTLCGTPDYLAPEIILSAGYNKSVDWYAWGVLIFEMLAGYPPFYSKGGDPASLYKRIIEGNVKYPREIDRDVEHLIRGCLTADLSKRYGNTVEGRDAIFRHQWFAEVEWGMLRAKQIPAPYIPDLRGAGDTSQFEQYAENDTSEYGAVGHDPFHDLFADFD